MEGVRQALFGMTVEHDAVTKALLDLLPEEVAELSGLALITWQVGLRATSLAFPRPTAKMTFSVPARRPASCPAPWISGSSVQPVRMTKVTQYPWEHRAYDQQWTENQPPARPPAWDFAYGLRRVRMQQHTMCTGHTTDLGNGLECTHLVISVQNTNREGLGRDGSAVIIRVDHPRPIHREIRHPQALLFQETAGVERGRVLNLRGNNMVTFMPVGVGHSLQDGISSTHSLRS